MESNEKREGAQFVRWFGPLLDALRKLGGSGSPVAKLGRQRLVKIDFDTCDD